MTDLANRAELTHRMIARSKKVQGTAWVLLVVVLKGMLFEIYKNRHRCIRRRVTERLSGSRR
jgi:hypothetical protein